MILTAAKFFFDSDDAAEEWEILESFTSKKRSVGDRFGLSKSTVCRVVHRVGLAVLTHSPNFVSWPTGKKALHIISGFEAKAGFPMESWEQSTEVTSFARGFRAIMPSRKSTDTGCHRCSFKLSPTTRRGSFTAAQEIPACVIHNACMEWRGIYDGPLHTEDDVPAGDGTDSDSSEPGGSSSDEDDAPTASRDKARGKAKRDFIMHSL
ncbi:hypothetical protein HPB47_012892 [Ixodes persulcatus]|uniref:Uncharacterized protein n=1 Tax=Ixodes persulcatus TaxID=34615 RepID=A0AC60NSE2_IXOPE|nr:hypothetical protein HPB47_012892 [Ixodes persulcatus]